MFAIVGDFGIVIQKLLSCQQAGMHVCPHGDLLLHGCSDLVIAGRDIGQRELYVTNAVEQNYADSYLYSFSVGLPLEFIKKGKRLVKNIGGA